MDNVERCRPEKNEMVAKNVGGDISSSGLYSRAVARWWDGGEHNRDTEEGYCESVGGMEYAKSTGRMGPLN